MSVINTNVKSIVAQNALTVNNRAMSKTMEQLSTGKRINSAADDAAGLAISSKMTSQVKGLNQAVRNANDAISLIQVAEGSLVEVTNMMQRMRELAVQSANDTNTTDDRNALNLEFSALKEEINRIGNNTQWNDMNIMDKSFSENGDAGKFKFQVGANAAQTIDLTIGDYRTSFTPTAGGVATSAVVVAGSEETAPNAGDEVAREVSLAFTGTYAAGDEIEISLGDETVSYTVVDADIGNDAAATLTAIATKIAAVTMPAGFTAAVDAADDTKVVFSRASGETFTAAATFTSETIEGDLNMIDDSNISTQADSNAAIISLDDALKTVNEGRAEMGATINRLNYAADNLTNVSQNTSESRSRILDTDYAQATTELARTQIISQAATAMLAQANQAPQSVLSLLR